MARTIAAIAILILVGACSKPARPVQGPQDRPAASKVPLPLPLKQRPTIDPKSAKAAVELARSFAQLLNRRKFDEAYRLLGDRGPERSKFDQWFAPYSNLDAAVGEAGDEEGAAGSVYVSVPLTIHGEFSDREVRRSATIILRRVNDIPGSTEAERHWHIERIGWPS